MSLFSGLLAGGIRSLTLFLGRYSLIVMALMRSLNLLDILILNLNCSGFGRMEREAIKSFYVYVKSQKTLLSVQFSAVQVSRSIQTIRSLHI
jgi:hypothetical protein